MSNSSGKPQLSFDPEIERTLLQSWRRQRLDTDITTHAIADPMKAIMGARAPRDYALSIVYDIH